MTAGRKKNTAAEPVTIDLETGALAEAAGALTVMSAELLEFAQLAGLKDLSPATLVREARVWQEHSAEAMFQVGVRLLALRQQCPRGEWIPLLRDEIGMSARTAQQVMAAALKCIGSHGRREKLLALDRSKVMELVCLDDAALDELDATGSLSQLSLELDDIDRMSPTELRRRLRDVEQSAAAKDKLIAKKDEKLNALQEQMERPFEAGAAAANAEEAAALLQLRDVVSAAESELMKLAHMLPAFTRGSFSEAASTAGVQGAQYLAQRLIEAMNVAGVNVDMDELVTPPWLAEAHAMAEAQVAAKATAKAAKKPARA